METNPGQRGPVPDVCRILCSNVLGLDGNLSDLTVCSSQCEIMLCSETGLRYTSRVGVAGSRILSPCLVVPWQDTTGSMVSEYVCDGYGAFCKPKFE